MALTVAYLTAAPLSLSSSSSSFSFLPPLHSSRLVLKVAPLSRKPCFASSEENPTPGPPLPDKKTQARDDVKKGQTTAIITGAIAVILGVAYLVLVQLLDSRGINLVPPPPEAFDL